MKLKEIIEFPVLKIDCKTLEIVNTFHQYVQPRVNKFLTPFCTSLTGITQDKVDNQPHLEETLISFDTWMKSDKNLKFDDENKNFIFVTCGDWDLRTMLPTQCKYFNIDYPKYLKQWINLKKSFCEVTGTFPKGMMQMLELLSIPHIGRHHSGIDDCRNIANVAKQLALKDYIFTQTGKIN